MAPPLRLEFSLPARRPPSTIALLLAGALAGCTANPDPIVTMDLRTDYVPGVQFTEVHTELRSTSGDAVRLPPTAVDRDTAMLPSFRAGQAVDGLAPGTDYRVTMRLMDGETEVASQTRRLNLRDDSVGLTFLITRACAAVSCTEGRVCDATGTCVLEADLCLGDPECVPEGGCQADAECTGGLACETGSCLDGQCLYVTDRELCGDDMLCMEGSCEAPPLDAPLHRGPPEGDFVGSADITDVDRVGGRPKLLWHYAGDSYDVEIYDCAVGASCPSGEAIRSAENILAPFWYVRDPLPAGRYFWHVRAHRNGATSDWSAGSHFWVGDRNDTDGDGRAELFVGSPDNRAPGEAGGSDVYRYAGAGAGGTSVLSMTGADFGSHLTVGDITGDGLSDVIAGGPLFNGVGTHNGVVKIYSEDADANELSLEPPTMTDNGMFGAGVAWLADLTGDGVGDFAVSEPGTGSVYVYAGVLDGGDIGGPIATLSVPALMGEQTSALEGCDVDADGRMDVVVGVAGAETSGAVFVFTDPMNTSTAGVTLSAPAGAAGFGAAVRCAPDLSGNGNNDLLVGAPDTAPAGAVFLVESGPFRPVVRIPFTGTAGGYGETVDAMQFGEQVGFSIIVGSTEDTSPALNLQLNGSWTINYDTGELAVGAPAVSMLTGGHCVARIGPVERGGHHWTLATPTETSVELYLADPTDPRSIAGSGSFGFGAACR